MLVRDIMSHPVYTVKSDASVQFAAEMMATHNVGALPIVNDGRLVGVLTDRDVVHRCMAPGLSPTEMKVSEIMSADPIALPPDADVDEAAHMFMNMRVRRLPIVESDRPVGMLTVDDVARLWGNDEITLLMVRRVAPLARRHAA
jgi:CBS domain-containing protein